MRHQLETVVLSDNYYKQSIQLNGINEGLDFGISDSDIRALIDYGQNVTHEFLSKYTEDS